MVERKLQAHNQSSNKTLSVLTQTVLKMGPGDLERGEGERRGDLSMSYCERVELNHGTKDTSLRS